MTHRRKVRAPLLLLMFGLTAVLLPAQATGSGDMDEGIRLFRGGQYDQAISHFRNVILDTAAAAARPEVYLLIGKSYMATGKLDDAEKSLEFYIANFGGAPDYPEALYQKGRLLYMQEQYEESIQALQSFISDNPGSSFVSSAWYWVGECLASLGRVDDAERIFRKVVTDFPSSVKVEAAQYRISLIRLQKKEIELARLLTWSHEDFLKSIEEFQRREKTYEQAIEAYQKRLGPLGSDQDSRTVADLRSELAKKTEEAAKLTAQLAQLSAAPAAGAVLRPVRRAGGPSRPAPAAGAHAHNQGAGPCSEGTVPPHPRIRGSREMSSTRPLRASLLSPLAVVLLLVCALQTPALDLSMGRMRLSLYEDIGRFSLSYAGSQQAAPPVPLLAAQDPRTTTLSVLMETKIYRMGERPGVFRVRPENAARGEVRLDFPPSYGHRGLLLSRVTREHRSRRRAHRHHAEERLTAGFQGGHALPVRYLSR